MAIIPLVAVSLDLFAHLPDDHRDAPGNVQAEQEPERCDPLQGVGQLAEQVGHPDEHVAPDHRHPDIVWGVEVANLMKGGAVDGGGDGETKVKGDHGFHILLFLLVLFIDQW